MKFAVRYYTKTGHSKKLAEAVAEELGVPAKSVEEPLEEKADYLVFCNSVYATQLGSQVKKFLEENKSNIGTVVNVSSAALLESSYSQMKKFTQKEGISLSDKEFHCHGQFLHVQKGHPDEEDLKKAKAFARLLKG